MLRFVSDAALKRSIGLKALSAPSGRGLHASSARLRDPMKDKYPWTEPRPLSKAEAYFIANKPKDTQPDYYLVPENRTVFAADPEKVLEPFSMEDTKKILAQAYHARTKKIPQRDVLEYYSRPISVTQGTLKARREQLRRDALLLEAHRVQLEEAAQADLTPEQLEKVHQSAVRVLEQSNAVTEFSSDEELSSVEEPEPVSDSDIDTSTGEGLLKKYMRCQLPPTARHSPKLRKQIVTMAARAGIYEPFLGAEYTPNLDLEWEQLMQARYHGAQAQLKPQHLDPDYPPTLYTDPDQVLAAMKPLFMEEGEEGEAEEFSDPDIDNTVLSIKEMKDEARREMREAEREESVADYFARQLEAEALAERRERGELHEADEQHESEVLDEARKELAALHAEADAAEDYFEADDALDHLDFGPKKYDFGVDKRQVPAPQNVYVFKGEEFQPHWDLEPFRFHPLDTHEYWDQAPDPWDAEEFEFRHDYDRDLDDENDEWETDTLIDIEDAYFSEYNFGYTRKKAIDFDSVQDDDEYVYDEGYYHEDHHDAEMLRRMDPMQVLMGTPGGMYNDTHFRPHQPPANLLAHKTRKAMWTLHLQDPVKWTFEALAEEFRLSVNRTRAIIRLESLEHQMMLAGDLPCPTEPTDAIFEGKTGQHLLEPDYPLEDAENIVNESRVAIWDPPYTPPKYADDPRVMLTEAEAGTRIFLDNKRFEKIKQEKIAEVKRAAERFATVGPFGAPSLPPPAPSPFPNVPIQKPLRHHLIMTDISDLKNCNFKIAVRDKNGVLRQPSEDEWYYVRRREKSTKEAFFYVKYEPYLQYRANHAAANAQ